MLEIQRLKRLIVPFVKGLPIIIGSLLIALFIAKKIIQYSVPQYQSIAKIKLDDSKNGLSSNNLFEDFDLFAREHKIETEAEVLKSSLLIKQAINKLELDVYLSRIGTLKKTKLYKETPLLFTYNKNNFTAYDKIYTLVVSSNSEFKIFEEDSKTALVEATFGKPFLVNNSELTIDLNTKVLNNKKLDIVGTYEFEIRSINKWAKVIKEQLDVKAVDKEIPIIRVVMKTESPEFSADFSNTLCNIYIQDYISTKSKTAKKTLDFVDQRMLEIQKMLSKSEDNLETYKLKHKVINILQETETGIRGLSNLQLQAIQLELEEKSIIDLEAYISSGDYYDETAILFGFGDLTLTELVKKLKLFSDEKKDLTLKYTENHPKVTNTQQKIDDVKDYIKEAITQNKRNIKTKRFEIQSKIDVMSKQFDDVPTRERELRMLQRDFQINESVYSFLAQKKLEAQIASSALISFHRIIQEATVAKKPVSPNKTLITFVLGLLGIFIGLFAVYSQKYLKGTIQDKTDIEKHTATPVIGVITDTKNPQEINLGFTTLATNLKLKSNGQKQTFLITSSIKQEGKTYISENLAQTYLEMGYSVATIDINPYHKTQTIEQSLEDLLTEKQVVKTQNYISIGLTAKESSGTKVLSHKNMETLITSIQNAYDIVIIDSPGSIISINALTLLKYCTKCLYVVCSNKSKVQYLTNIENIKEDYKYDNMGIVFNKAPILSSYSGNFFGAQLHYKQTPKGFMAKIKHYYKYYS